MKNVVVFVLFLAHATVCGQSAAVKEADSLFALGHYAKAINSYAGLGTSKAGLQMARAYTAMGHTGKAIAQYGALVEADSTLPLARFELAKLLFKTHRHEEALGHFQYLAKAWADNPENHFFVGEAQRKLGRMETAQEAYASALEQDSTHLRSLFRLARHHTGKGETSQALTYIERGLAFYEDDVGLVNLKALVLYNYDRYQEAIPWFEKVLALGEEKAFVYEKLAHSHYKAWEFEKAKKRYLELLEIDDSDAHHHYALAEVYRKNKQVDSAHLWVRKGMQLQRPLLAKGHMALSVLARENDDLEQALAHLRSAVKETPEDGMLFFRLCMLIDRHYDDPQMKLDHFEKYMDKFGGQMPYFRQMAQKRITALKEQIHSARPPGG
ncbi:tetratricopeptide repeat protein [Maribacter sp. 2307ULW6-5]|uniref:tetratricopeptide repeat protein n=1 Tax=Maribacter sp. 2307ULW6-5 TaxID=3386275 RepID=UPI0039BD3E62